jgi:hypothetical protein
VATR